jgi:hypothetical protein
MRAADNNVETDAMREACEYVLAALTEAAEVEGLAVADRAFLLRARGRYARIGQISPSALLTVTAGGA